MYVGHSLLAFVLVAGARVRGTTPSRALALGVTAAGFAVVPDLDGVYTLWIAATAGPAKVFPTPQYVWTNDAWLVHRTMTHSLVVGGITAVMAAVAADAFGRSGSPPLASIGAVVAACTVVGSIAVTAAGVTGVLTIGGYLAAALLITAVATRRGLVPAEIGGCAGVGLLTHPFGDVFMGRPPVFLFPLTNTPPVATVVVAPDPTVNLVALFGLELALAWGTVLTASRLTDRPLRSLVARHAVLGVSFAVLAPVIRPPTLDVAYHFALGVLGTGILLGFLPVLVAAGFRRPDRDAFLVGLVTALAAVSFAVAAYLVAYLVVAS